MTARALATVLAVGLAAGASAQSGLSEAWLHVQSALATGDVGAIEGGVADLEDAAREVAAYRLTPFAAALVAWSEEHHGEAGETTMRLARRLDPTLPSSYFLEARLDWRRGRRVSAAGAYLAGWARVVRAERLRAMLLASLGVWFLLALAITFAVVAVLVTGGHVRELAHDAWELGRLLFAKPNAVVFTVAILGLPLFAGLGPLWLAAYLFAMCWVYLSGRRRAVAFVACLVLALVLPAFGIWERTMLHDPPLATRVADMLADRRLDLASLRELADLEGELDQVADYHLVLGELLRLHGDSEGARVEYQKAALARPAWAVPLVFLANLSLEDGDLARAMERYNESIQLDQGNAIAWVNLSRTYDLSRRFQDGDAARIRARGLAGRRLDELGLPGRDRRIKYPRLGREDVARLLAEAPAESRLVAELGRPYLHLVRELRSPLALTFIVTGLLGVAVLVVRRRLMWTASACTRCGKVFCPRCKTATESAIYCSQCISVFLKRDLVSIEQQTTKLEQVRRWEATGAMLRRVVGVLLPGGNRIVAGKVWSGVAVGFAAWSSLVGALVWAPRFLPSVEPLVSPLPVEIALGLCFLALWGRSALTGWYRR